MAQLQQSVDIARPLEEVFAFVANPGNDAQWGSNLLEVTQVSRGPLGVGARFRYKARFAGRQFELVREVTEYEPNRRQAVKTISGPLRFGGVRTFEAIPGGTRITLTGGGRAAFRLGRAAAVAGRPAVVAKRPCQPQAAARGPAPSLATLPASHADHGESADPILEPLPERRPGLFVRRSRYEQEAAQRKNARR
jgi:hypothetical protein